MSACTTMVGEKHFSERRIVGSWADTPKRSTTNSRHWWWHESFIHSAKFIKHRLCARFWGCSREQIKVFIFVELIVNWERQIVNNQMGQYSPREVVVSAMEKIK